MCATDAPRARRDVVAVLDDRTMHSTHLSTSAFGDPTAEQRLVFARSLLHAVRDLGAEVTAGAGAVPASMCTAWRSEAAANYEVRLEELRAEVHHARARIDDTAVHVERGIRQLELEIATARDAAARAVAAGPADWHSRGRGSWTTD